MARKRYKPDEIVSLLRQAEVLHGQGMSTADAIQQWWPGYGAQRDHVLPLWTALPLQGMLI